ncbi:Hypothetical protein, putative [Bodo saltans]|uniref:Uncharacterized protein n=1 Tax=Bodo saltans TaxID=75058 RepID=A0A0S4KKN5_BODSA|nr:Hypothetical protein, putative [Bodo saltans]|eukprot:CUI14959.1 Hypothetical protein, putative [Bodo saltans]
MGNSCACETDYGDINSYDNDHAHAPPVHHPSVAARLASVQALTSRLPIAKPNVSSSPRLPLSPPSVVHEQTRSPEAPADLQCPRSHPAVHSRKGRVPKQSSRLCPSAFHSVMPPTAQFDLRAATLPTIGLDELQLLGCRPPLTEPTLFSLKESDTLMRKQCGKDEDARVGEEDACRNPLMTPFQRRRTEARRQRRAAEGDPYNTNPSMEPSLTNDSHSTAPMLGDEFSNNVDAFA